MDQLLLEYEACVDRRVVGGKAYRIAELWKAGFQVPDGFVIPTTVSKTAIETSSLPKVDPSPKADSAKPYMAPRVKRRRFLNAAIFATLESLLEQRLKRLSTDVFVVRSSSTVEDSEHRSEE